MNALINFSSFVSALIASIIVSINRNLIIFGFLYKNHQIGWQLRLSFFVQIGVPTLVIIVSSYRSIKDTPVS